MLSCSLETMYHKQHVMIIPHSICFVLQYKNICCAKGKDIT